MKRLIGRILEIAAATFVLSVACEAQEPIYLGLSAPMTGQYAENGAKMKEGIDLAIKQINAAGGIDGRSFELVLGDSEGAPDLAKRIARKFVSDSKIVAELGDFTSTCSMAAQPIYDKAGLVQLSPTTSHPGFAPGSPYSFSIVGTQAGAPFMARQAIERLGKKRLAVAYLDTDWGVSMKEYFVKEAMRLGAEIVATESYFEGTTDFSTLLKNIRAAQPEVLFLASMVPDAVGISKQRQLDGWTDVVVMGLLSIQTPELLNTGGEAVENLITSTLFFPNNPRPEVQNFITAYETAYQTPPNWVAAVGYDSLNLLADAIKQGGAERSAIQKALAATKEYAGVTGKFIFSQYGDVVREYTLLQVKNGEFVLFDGK